jgi:methionyl-tRNA formyltransferase
MDVLPQWQAGTIHAIEQDAALATYAPRIEKRDGLINWERDDASMIARQVRAYHPWPSAYGYLDGAPLRIIEAIALADNGPGHAPGTIVETEADLRALDLSDVAFTVIAASGALGVMRVQPPGGSAMSAAAYLNGHRGIIGRRLTSR